MQTFFLATSMVILLAVSLCLYRAIRGPAIIDRIIAVNVIDSAVIYGFLTFLPFLLMAEGAAVESVVK